MAVNYDSQEDALHMRVFRNRPEPGHKRVHVHPTHELNFLCHGYQGLEVENRNYTMCPGDLLVLPAGMEHSIRSEAYEQLLNAASAAGDAGPAAGREKRRKRQFDYSKKRRGVQP